MTAGGTGPEHAAPARRHGDGPDARLVLRAVTVIDGTGAPPWGPVDVVIDGNRIADVRSHDPSARHDGARVLDLDGHYVLPGLVDSHAHIAWPSKVPNAQYVYDLWLAHGVTSVREVGCVENGLAFTRGEAERSAANEIAAPRIWPYLMFGWGRDAPFTRPDEAREWVREAAAGGAAGVKFFGQRPEIFRAALEECAALGLGSAAHLDQRYVAAADAVTAAGWGLRTVEHWYGLPESTLGRGRVQRFAPGYDYADEQARFAAAGELWHEAAAPGSERWARARDELIARDVTLVPTFSVYIGMRDADRVRNAEWHRDFSVPSLWDYWRPSHENHGSAWWDWGTTQELRWRANYQRWMAFVGDYLDHGGRVAMGTDAGFMYQLHGFAVIEEMELLAEAGLHPLEVVRAATLAGAEVLGAEAELGTVAPGRLADLVVVGENPLANLKVLRGTGHLRLDEHGTVRRVGGVRHTIKDGIVYDAERLLANVARTVAEERLRAGTPAEAVPPGLGVAPRGARAARADAA